MTGAAAGRPDKSDSKSSSSPQRRQQQRPASGGPAMRIVVPLRGVVQGRGGLVLGSLIPCALFYFFQLYLKRNRPPNPPPSDLLEPSEPSASPPLETSSPVSSSGIHRSLSRGGLLSPRSNPHLSARAAAVTPSRTGEEDSLYYAGLRRCREDPYDSVANPDGVVQLGLAENRLSLDLITRWMEEHAEKALLGGGGEKRGLSIRGLATYQPFDGLMDLKMSVAGFMSQVMQGSVSFDPSQMVLTSGATPAMEILSFCLADPGNAFLVPSPYYPGWDRDIKWRTGIELIPVPCRSTDNFNICIPALERAYNQAKKRGVKVRAVLISNPSNPVGSIVHKETFHGLLDFATEKNIHLISDEVFAGSTYGNSKFVSVSEVLDNEDVERSRVHIVYGLSKDLSVPGFRVGVIYSYNENVLAAAAKLARFSSISTPTQQLLVAMLSDTKFISEYLKVNTERLRRMYSLFIDALKQLGIECFSSSGGFYCWADMSRYIQSYSENGEHKLWYRLLNEAKVNVTPGSSCYCIEPGWFRCCFTTLSEEDIPLVVERFRRVTESHKPWR